MNLEEVKTVLDLAKLWNDMGSQISDLFLNAFMAIEKEAIDLREQLMDSESQITRLRRENEELKNHLDPPYQNDSNITPPNDYTPFYTIPEKGLMAEEPKPPRSVEQSGREMKE
jgi:hypothetical protein